MTGGDRDSLRQATVARRYAVRGVARAVEDVLASSGRPALHRDDVFGILEAAVLAEVSSGTFGVRDDLELPTLPDRRASAPTRDVAAERKAAAIEAAEERVRQARTELAKAEAALAEARRR